MGINLGNVSSDDVNRVKNIRNPPSQDAGDDLGGGFDDMFGDDSFSDLDMDDIFGKDESSDPFSGSGSSGGMQPFGQSSGGFGQSSGGFGQPNNTFGQPNNTFGQPFGAPNAFGGASFGGGFNGFNQGGAQNNMPVQKDNWDRMFDFSADGLMNIGQVLIELVKSIKNRTADDIGYYSTNLIKTGFIGMGVFIILCIVSWLTKVQFLGINGISSQFILAFALTTGMGCICLGIAAWAISGTAKDCVPDIKSMPDAGIDFEDDATSDYEDELGDIMADLFGDDEDDPFEIPEEVSVEPSTEPEIEDDIPVFTPSVKPDFKSKLNALAENRLINRKLLVSTFLEFLPLNNPDFAKRKEVEVDSELFAQMETICLKAMSNVLKCEPEAVNSHLNSLYETFFSYEMRMKRVRGLNRVNDLATELEVYLKDNPNDTSVNATVEITADDYYIVVTKGVSAVVTMGDCFTQPSVKKFYENDKNKLPMITGITELGEVIVDDAKMFDTMLIAGKPRSGKSWYVLSILLSLMMFNPPSDVQFIIVDPKESNLFKTLALMPHVAGIHNDSNILEVMDDIISNEAARRKKILADNRCDDIWALRKKGIEMPVLYLVIDEYITVKSNLGELDKELDAKLQVMISQLPSQGIRLIFVPHRATGVVNKTNRTMLQFTAAVRSDVEDANDTLSIKNWKRPLTNPGDIAVKSSANPNAKFVRGAAITTSDEDNSDLIENLAKAFYKMGVDLPDMSSMTVAVNRDEDEIREILCSDNHIQYNAANVFNSDI